MPASLTESRVAHRWGVSHRRQHFGRQTSVDRPTNVPDRPGLLYGLIWHEGEIKSSVFGIFQLGRVTCLMSCWEPATPAVRGTGCCHRPTMMRDRETFMLDMRGKHLVYLLKDTTNKLVRIRVNGLIVFYGGISARYISLQVCRMRQTTKHSDMLKSARRCNSMNQWFKKVLNISW